MKQLLTLQLGADLLEQQAHGSYAFPLEVYLDELDLYDKGRVDWHWHPEVEFGAMLQGRALVSVPGHTFPLAAGQGFFINSNVLHQMEPLEQGATFFSIVLSPTMLAGHTGSALGQKYVTPLLECDRLPALALTGEQGWHTAVLTALKGIAAAYDAALPGYELAITAALLTAWQALYTGCHHLLAADPGEVPLKDGDRLRAMLEHIHAHYPDPLTLAQIAASASLSTSECCRCFKRALKTTPFAYLNQHRLAAAAKLLKNGMPPRSVYGACGYNSQSWFGKQFKALYGCTPLQYQNRP